MIGSILWAESRCDLYDISLDDVAFKLSTVRQCLLCLLRHCAMTSNYVYSPYIAILETAFFSNNPVFGVFTAGIGVACPLLSIRPCACTCT